MNLGHVAASSEEMRHSLSLEYEFEFENSRGEARLGYRDRGTAILLNHMTNSDKSWRGECFPGFDCVTIDFFMLTTDRGVVEQTRSFPSRLTSSTKHHHDHRHQYQNHLDPPQLISNPLLDQVVGRKTTTVTCFALAQADQRARLAKILTPPTATTVPDLARFMNHKSSIKQHSVPASWQQTTKSTPTYPLSLAPSITASSITFHTTAAHHSTTAPQIQITTSKHTNMPSIPALHPSIGTIASHHSIPSPPVPRAILAPIRTPKYQPQHRILALQIHPSCPCIYLGSRELQHSTTPSNNS
ncbi:hypothetical protein EJ07DRAFT_158493 [Lizonia empirigonia]|nr:hypothetical protein EJ07DRAFT_158493 [Lizonia empirigonia]